MSTIEHLRRIANMAGAPTMDYAPEVALVEPRRTLDAIAALAADAIKEEMPLAERERQVRLLDDNNVNSMFSPLFGVPPKTPPYWVSHTKRLFYRDQMIADLRFSPATPERVEFMVKALNDAEEKPR